MARILIGPIEVSGIASAMKEGFDRIGVEAELVLSQPHPFAYGSARRPPFLARIWQALGAAHVRAAGAGSWLRLPFLLVWKAWSILVLVWSLWRFDRFVFLFGNTLTNTEFEAWLLERLGKKVAVLFCGSDARPPYIDGWAVHSAALSAPEQLVREAARRKARIRRLERHGFTCVNSPFTGQYHGRPYVSSFALGVPRPFPDSDAPAPAREPRGPVRALHSPSNPSAKGTPVIVEAVEQLKREGMDIDLAILTDVPNHLVLAEIARADFVIDQLYSDTPMASFPAEAAVCGRPAVVCGYSAADGLEEIIRAPVAPSLYVRQEDLVEALRRMAGDAAFRARLGREAQEFVRRHWSPEAVAERYLRILTGPPPPEWVIEPGAHIYVHGAGVSESDGRRAVAAVIRAGGPGALQLDDSPHLLHAFVAFAALDSEAEPG